MFPLLASWNELEGTPMEEPLDGTITKAAHRRIYAKQIATEIVYERITEQWGSHEWARRLNCHM